MCASISKIHDNCFGNNDDDVDDGKEEELIRRRKGVDDYDNEQKEEKVHRHISERKQTCVCIFIEHELSAHAYFSDLIFINIFDNVTTFLGIKELKAQTTCNVLAT